jgi:hypothetical protein
MNLDLTPRERELLMLFLLGMALGFIGIAIAEACVVAADQADRQRIREELERFWAELPQRSSSEKVVAIAALPATQLSEETKGVIVCQ